MENAKSILRNSKGKQRSFEQVIQKCSFCVLYSMVLLLLIIRTTVQLSLSKLFEFLFKNPAEDSFQVIKLISILSVSGEKNFTAYWPTLIWVYVRYSWRKIWYIEIEKHTQWQTTVFENPIVRCTLQSIFPIVFRDGFLKCIMKYSKSDDLVKLFHSLLDLQVCVRIGEQTNRHTHSLNE